MNVRILSAIVVSIVCIAAGAVLINGTHDKQSSGVKHAAAAPKVPHRPGYKLVGVLGAHNTTLTVKSTEGVSTEGFWLECIKNLASRNAIKVTHTQGTSSVSETGCISSGTSDLKPSTDIKFRATATGSGSWNVYVFAPIPAPQLKPLASGEEVAVQASGVGNGQMMAFTPKSGTYRIDVSCEGSGRFSTISDEGVDIGGGCEGGEFNMDIPGFVVGRVVHLAFAPSDSVGSWRMRIVRVAQ